MLAPTYPSLDLVLDELRRHEERLTKGMEANANRAALIIGFSSFAASTNLPNGSTASILSTIAFVAAIILAGIAYWPGMRDRGANPEHLYSEYSGQDPEATRLFLANMAVHVSKQTMSVNIQQGWLTQAAMSMLGLAVVIVLVARLF